MNYKVCYLVAIFALVTGGQCRHMLTPEAASGELITIQDTVLASCIGHFMCKVFPYAKSVGLTCLHAKYVCDGIPHCWDGSDEFPSQCGKHTSGINDIIDVGKGGPIDIGGKGGHVEIGGMGGAYEIAGGESTFEISPGMEIGYGAEMGIEIAPGGPDYDAVNVMDKKPGKKDIHDSHMPKHTRHRRRPYFSRRRRPPFMPPPDYGEPPYFDEPPPRMRRPRFRRPRRPRIPHDDQFYGPNGFKDDPKHMLPPDHDKKDYFDDPKFEGPGPGRRHFDKDPILMDDKDYYDHMPKSRDFDRPRSRYRDYKEEPPHNPDDKHFPSKYDFDHEPKEPHLINEEKYPPESPYYSHGHDISKADVPPKKSLPYEHKPPPYDHKPPPYEHKSPPYEHKPPPYEHKSPPYEHKPPPYEHKPPTDPPPKKSSSHPVPKTIQLVHHDPKAPVVQKTPASYPTAIVPQLVKSPTIIRREQIRPRVIHVVHRRRPRVIMQRQPRVIHVVERPRHVVVQNPPQFMTRTIHPQMLPAQPRLIAGPPTMVQRQPVLVQQPQPVIQQPIQPMPLPGQPMPIPGQPMPYPGQPMQVPMGPPMPMPMPMLPQSPLGSIPLGLLAEMMD